MLTTKQERYCQLRASGMSQRTAYREAYPASQCWKDSSVDCEASKLEKTPKVLQRLTELQEDAARNAVASRTAIIDRLASVNADAFRISMEKMKEGKIDKDATNVLMQSGSKLLDVLPDDSAREGEAQRVFDFGRLLSRGFIDLHREIWLSQFDEYWMEGGRGSGKTSTIAMEIVAGVSSFSGRNAVVMRNRTNKLRTSVYAEIKKAAHRLEVFDEFEWGKSPLQAVHKPTGNIIYFFGADNVNPEDSPLKGLSFEQGYCAYIWFEEASQFPGYAYIRNVKQTLLRGGSDMPTWTFLSYNPPRSANAWVNRESREPQDGRRLHRSHFKDMPREWLGKAFLAAEAILRKRNPKAAEHEYDGKAIGTGANVIDVDIELRAITEEERGRLDNISHGVDFGSVHPYVHERVAYDTENNVLYILNEYTATGREAHDTETAPRLIEDLERFGEDDFDVWCDSAEPSSITYYQDHGINARKAYKQGVNSPTQRIRWFNRLAKIVIDNEECPMAAHQFPSYEYVTTSAGDITTTLPKVDDDTIDAVGYAASIWIRQGL